MDGQDMSRYAGEAFYYIKPIKYYIKWQFSYVNSNTFLFKNLIAAKLWR